jgi:hypothetical protein
MNTKNQTEQDLLELAVNSAANEDQISSAIPREATSVARKEMAWSPYEVWRTRVKASAPRSPVGRALI